MTLEKSHGKLRPTLPRASELRASSTVGAASSRDRGRDASGRFVAGHTHGTDSRAKHVVGKSLGSPDARKIYFAVMRSLPSKAPTVRGLVALHAQHMAQHAALTTAAEAAGIATPEGQKLMALADEQGRRAERTLVTAHDLARIAAESEAKARPPAWQQWAPPTTEDDEADDQQPESKETDDDE